MPQMPDDYEDFGEDESEGMTLRLNDEGVLEEFKEEDWISVKKTDMDLIQAYIEANQEDFTVFCRERAK